MPAVGFSWQKKTLLKDPHRVLLGRVPVCCIMAGKKFESPRLENSLSQMGENVRGEEEEVERKDRGCQKSSGPAVSYSKPLCRVAIFSFFLAFL